ncbi:MAG: succinylglutamate desuccinylase/aspartoacylase family protein [Desulfovibrionaceae bacterium]|nr:succinylglutamate desuccinylase/aspartoacylase family protein [Desulfovibrionaceae bacterium]MBF0512912.1 succinylglutamate desuccinylase/aspartoacylase family protein [Desulfovibrionaceae bacterium]
MRNLAMLFFGPLLLLTSVATASAEVHTFFAGTQYALDVYFLRGEKPGPTIMVQGGIQGDEFCGYLTAQLLTRAKVTKGTLIVVPRANPPSIHERKRQVNVDLNRRFDRDYNQFFEDRLARLIRYLVDQSQGLIHLHEGSGFYDPVKRDDMHGPKRYGQSVIIDATEYKNLQLAQTVKQILAQLNEGVKPEQYKFKLFNMDTFNDRSEFLEQRKSLTYYTLTNVGAPALDIEVSKNLVGRYWSYWKVSHQMQGTLLFLRKFGLELEVPPVRLEDFQAYPPQNVKVVVNGQTIDPAKPQLNLTPGAPLDVRCDVTGQQNPLEPIASVFASDRFGFNVLKVRRVPLVPFESLDVRSDGLLLAKAKVSWTGPGRAAQAGKDGDLICWLNGELKTVSPGQALTAVQGDQLILEGIKGSARQEMLRLKGNVSRCAGNPGLDAGQEIILDPKVFLPKYFLKSNAPGETVCEVARETPGGGGTRFAIRIVPREVSELVLASGDGKAIVIPWQPEKNIRLPAGRYVLKDIRGNGPRERVQAFCGNAPIEYGQPFEVKDASEIILRQATTFAELGKMALTGAAELPLASQEWLFSGMEPL